MSHVLIATLGDSPIVVTSIFCLLREQERLTIDRLLVLHPEGDNRSNGYIMIDETLKEHCIVESRELPFEDTYTEGTCFIFLRELFAILNYYQQQGDTVSLSLAGGRKNMSALMALAAPFYRCVKGLYHVIDKSEYTDKKNFKAIQELARLYELDDKTRFIEAMHPDINDLQLVPIPFQIALRVPESYLQKLLSMTAEQLQKLWEKDPDEAEKEQFMLSIVKPDVVDPLLQVYLTEQAKGEYDHLTKHDSNLAQDFVFCLKNMRFVGLLNINKHPIPDLKRKKLYSCYVYRKGSTTERPFFHTEPGDIANYPQNSVDSVVVERLAKHRTRTTYIPSVEQLLETSYSKGDKLYTLEEVVNTEKPIPGVLIVPMGTQPMVATQLYTLLTNRERRAIQEVILLYPAGADAVFNSVQAAVTAFKYEGVTCNEKAIKRLEDVASQEDCELYQNVLEQTIKGLQETYLQQNPDWRIDLALSGGRKGMAALALFAAQRTQLREVYHTLIANKDLDRQIEFEMEAKEFSRLKQKEKNDKLFLRAYKTHETDFRLFKVPIGPLHGK